MQAHANARLASLTNLSAETTATVVLYTHLSHLDYLFVIVIVVSSFDLLNRFELKQFYQSRNEKAKSYSVLKNKGMPVALNYLEKIYRRKTFVKL